MADIVLIIGNGFDLDLGLPSKYSDFIKSQEWRDLMKRFPSLWNHSENSPKSLLEQLQLASEDSQWFDIEEEIHRFVKTRHYCSLQEVDIIRKHFKLIKECLSCYLNRVLKDFKADEKKLGYQLLTLLQESPLTIFEIIFNYTYPHDFLKKPTYYTRLHVSFVHGELAKGNIVLGCDLQEGEKVNRQLSFMYKYNMLTKANNTAYHLQEAKEIIFYGHSVNEMDFRYFKDFLQTISTTPSPQKHLTFITYDEVSEHNIKDNIQSQGVSVTGLYNNLRTFEFIYTQKYNNRDKVETEKVNDLFKRLIYPQT